jgi:flagellar basal-body rod protein FlgB
MMNKLDAALNFHQTALRVRNQRQEILASNIANADTPQYKARDIDFASTLQNALQQTQGGMQAGRTQSGGLQISQENHMGGTATGDTGECRWQLCGHGCRA